MKLFYATIRVAVNAEACDNSVSGACDWFSGLLSDNNDVFDWAYGTKKIDYLKPILIEVDEKSYNEGDLFCGKVPIKKVDVPICSKCKKPLDTKRAVTREYVARNRKENEDSYLAGHYDQSGNFEPDGNPSYPVVNHDLVDGSDTCTSCGEVVG